MNLVDREARAHRARNLGHLNGLAMVLVRLEPPTKPTQAVLELHFFKKNQVQAIFNDTQASRDFPISGGFPRCCPTSH